MSAEPSRAPRTDFRRNAGVSLSLANLCLIDVWRSLFSATKDQYYFVRSLVIADYVGAIVALLLLAVGFFALLTVPRTPRGRFFGNAVLAVFVLISLNLIRLGSPISLQRLRDSASAPVWGVALIVLLVTLWTARRRFFSGLRLLILILAPFVLVTVSRVSWGALQAWLAAPGQATNAPREKEPKAATSGTRVVIFLFDELDERFLNPGTRPGDLDLPELDRLRGESVVFNNALRAGAETLTAVPALTTGADVLSAQPAGMADLELTYGGQRSTWRGRVNLFDLATAEGHNVRIVGWYHPYCRLFPAVAACGWQSHSQSWREPSGELPGIVVEDLQTLNPLNRRRLALNTYSDLFKDAIAQVNSGPGLVWVHWPIPHLPVIYDRKARSTTWKTSDALAGYLDNVALVDRTVGAVRQAMGVSWEESTIFLLSDHNWRQSAAYDGKASTRVPFYVKLPRGAGKTVDSEVTARVLPYLAMASLRGDLQSGDDVARLALAGAVEPLR